MSSGDVIPPGERTSSLGIVYYNDFKLISYLHPKAAQQDYSVKLSAADVHGAMACDQVEVTSAPVRVPNQRPLTTSFA